MVSSIDKRYLTLRAKLLKTYQKDDMRELQIMKDNGEIKKEYPFYRHVKTNLKLRTEVIRSQNHKCSICGDAITERQNDTHWDHCHTTGKVRGALCLNCNYGLGNFKDNVEILEKAINYLKYWKQEHIMKTPYKYDIVEEKLKENGRKSYLLRHVAKNGGVHEVWVGTSKLRRFIAQDRITNPPAEVPNYQPIEEKKGFSLPDVFEVPRPQYRIELRQDGMYNIYAPDGSMYDDEGMPKDLAEGYVRHLNENKDA